MSWDSIHYEAKLAAIQAHEGQLYSDIFPYEKHLTDAVNVGKRYGFDGDIITAIWLHDSIEDGNLTYNKIRDNFGKRVAEMVFAVTDELGRNRKERKAKTYPKIRENRDAIIVKLLDRIANIEHGLKHNSPQLEMYVKENREFYTNLFSPSIRTDLMWEYVNDLILKAKNELCKTEKF